MNISSETANENNSDPPRQFQYSLGTLFTISTFCCIFAASLVWVFRTEHLGKLMDMPIWLPNWLFVFPGRNVIGSALISGLLVLPVLCLGMVVVSAVLVVCTPNRPFSFLLFFGYVGVVLFTLFVPGSYWNDSSVQIVAALSLSACLTLAEVLIRRLPRNHFIAALLAMCTAFGYYLFLVCVIVTSAV